MTTDIWKVRQEPDKFSPHEMSTGAPQDMVKTQPGIKAQKKLETFSEPNRNQDEKP